MSVTDYFANHPHRTAIAGTILLGAVACLDYITGTEISFSVFYLAPVLFVSWYTSETFGILVAIAGAILWFLMDTVLGGKTYSHFLIPYWNAVVRAGFFIISGVLLSRLRTALTREHTIARLKTEMVSIVSHEFNNSLVSINLASTLLEEEEADNLSAHRQKLYGILSSTQKLLSRTVKTFLSNARMESGKFALELRPVKLREIVRDALDLVKPLAEEKKIDIVTDFPDTPIPIQADPDALSLVMGNLIGNAIKYTQSGGHVIIRIKLENEPGNSATVSVEDNGTGIAQEDLEAVFSGFYRTRQGKNSAKGFGLGLKVSKELIEHHGSKLLVESNPGHGAKFYFTLPTANFLQ